MSREISLDVKNGDPQFVKWYEVANKTIELLAVSVFEARQVSSTSRRDESVTRWTAYLGTLIEEAGNAAAHALVLEMPRAALILNRQVFEYRIRLAYLYAHPEKAEALLDSLPYTVLKEARNAHGFFEPEMLQQYETNFREWAEEHPELDSQTNEQGFRPMAEEILGETFSRDFFFHYSLPSIIAHGKPQGMVDVLEMVDGRPVWHPNSRMADASSEFSKLAYSLLGAILSIRERYSLDMKPFNLICGVYNNTFGSRA